MRKNGERRGEPRRSQETLRVVRIGSLLLLELEDRRVRVVRDLRQDEEVVSTEALAGLPCIAILVVPLERDVVARAALDLVLPNRGLDVADVNVSGRFLGCHCLPFRRVCVSPFTEGPGGTRPRRKEMPGGTDAGVGRRTAQRKRLADAANFKRRGRSPFWHEVRSGPTVGAAGHAGDGQPEASGEEGESVRRSTRSYRD